MVKEEKLEKVCEKCKEQIRRIHVKNDFIDDFEEECGCDNYRAYMVLASRSIRASKLFEKD